MFFRIKKVRSYEYLQIVESYREKGKMRQRVMITFGSYQHWKESGKLDSLLASGARLSEKLAMVSALTSGGLFTAPSCTGYSSLEVTGRR
jgi:hypothetical protein